MSDPVEAARATAFWLQGVAITVVASFLGRLMYHARQVQRGERRFLSLCLLWELPIAFGMGLIAGGLGDLFGLEGRALWGAAAIVGYLGPHAIDQLFIVARDAARARMTGDTDKS